MKEINFVSKFKDKITKIKRKIYLNDSRLQLILELALAFVLVSLLRKRTAKLPIRSLISNRKILGFNCVKV